MDVLVFFCLGIISSILIDQIKSRTVKVSFISLNIVLFVFVVLSSNDSVVSQIVSRVIDERYYSTLHSAMHNQNSTSNVFGETNSRFILSIMSYSTYGFLYCFMIVELFYSFVATLVETIKMMKKEIATLVKRFVKKPKFTKVFVTIKKYCEEIYFNQVNVSYPMRC